MEGLKFQLRVWDEDTNQWIFVDDYYIETEAYRELGNKVPKGFWTEVKSDVKRIAEEHLVFAGYDVDFTVDCGDDSCSMSITIDAEEWEELPSAEKRIYIEELLTVSIDRVERRKL